MKIVWFVCLLIIIIENGKSQFYQLPIAPPYDQNFSSLPLPYQTINQPLPPPPYPYPPNYAIPPDNQAYANAYYALLAQQGRGVYQYPAMGYGGYPQLGIGYPQMGPGYPIGMAAPQPSIGYPPQSAIATRQDSMGRNVNGKTEILDVSPEYQRQVLGWPAESSGTSGQRAVLSKPKYTVNVDTHTTNNTVIPGNMSKPIVSEKKFITSIRRTFVYDSSKPENIKPINIHIVNGQQVTTTPPPTTTENENVEGLTTSTVKPSGRRFMDVPKSCPKGTSMAQNGECIEPFAFRNPNNKINVENEIEESKI